MTVEMIGGMLLLAVIAMLAGAIITAATGKNYASAGIIPLGIFYLAAAVGALADKKTPDGFGLIFFVFGTFVFFVSYLATVMLKNREHEATKDSPAQF